MLVSISPAYAALTTHSQPHRTARTVAKRLYQIFIITPYLVITSLMLADIFTKALARETFTKFRDKLMNIAEVTVSDVAGNSVTLGGRSAQLWNKLVSYTRT